MNFYFTKRGADSEASRRMVEVAQKGASSGWRRLHYKSERFLRIFWRVKES